MQIILQRSRSNAVRFKQKYSPELDNGKHQIYTGAQFAVSL